MAGVVDRSARGGTSITASGRAWPRHLIALLLVLAAAAFVVLALTTGRTAWAWASIGASAVVAVGLVVDAVSRRRAGDVSGVERARPDGGSPELAVGQADQTDQDGTAHQDEAAGRDETAGRSGTEAVEPAEPAGPGAAARPVGSGREAGAALVDAAGDAPGGEDAPEEDTDAADLLLVAELTDEVRVVDEHPRYHLASCPNLDGRVSLPLPLREARELEFTPCARCRPDATLAARQRRAVGH
ncbi:hypothetical protein [Goodfellowiella coeruleoviolacea]|uniref:Uncharacterized protein n=1 Tax=Goodfellowiella coeruleoviolacea TaxID=334858 RepID=A0AAE3GJR4_9PSEU|nr:hypothetical protein [Goodfellowiella coeruleoviolacea]MCP2169531.1 hypothetical protein [Goodfellowiella coeruleoviolacea]